MSSPEQQQVTPSGLRSTFNLLREARKLPKKILSDEEASHELTTIAKHALLVSPLVLANNLLRITLPAWYQETRLPEAKWPSIVAYVLISLLAAHQEYKTIKSTRRSMSSETTGLHLLAPAMHSIFITRGAGLLKSLAIVSGVIALKETNTIGNENEAQLLTTYFSMLCLWMLGVDVVGNKLLHHFLSEEKSEE